MAYGRPPPKGRLYSTPVVEAAVGSKNSVGNAFRTASVRPYVTIKWGRLNVHAFGAREVAVWRRWPIDLTERLLEMAAELRVVHPRGRDTQSFIDKEVERWKTETATNDTQ